MDKHWTQIPEFKHHSVSEDGQIRNDRTGNILTIRTMKRGYRIVNINDDGKQYTRNVDKIFRSVFVDNLADISLPNEQWRPIPGLERYHVSDHGRVLGVFGRIVGTKDPRGRAEISFKDKDNANRTMFIHHAVALAFIGPRPEGMEVCHNDGNVSNNNLNNLRYDTHQANIDDKWIHGTMLYGAKGSTAKLTEDQVYEIRASTESSYSVAERLGMHPTTIQKIRNGKLWKRLP